MDAEGHGLFDMVFAVFDGFEQSLTQIDSLIPPQDPGVAPVLLGQLLIGRIPDWPGCGHLEGSDRVLAIPVALQIRVHSPSIKVAFRRYRILR